MKKPIFLVAVIVFFMLSADNIFGCSCLVPSNQPLSRRIKKAYLESAAVFYGEVTEITQKPEDFDLTVKIKVEKSWKNQTRAEVIIHTGRGGGDCGYNFEVGNKYLVYAYANKNTLETNIWMRTSASDA